MTAVDHDYFAFPEKETETLPRTGIAGNSLVMTLQGEISATDLCIGDRVITRDAGAIKIKALHKRKSANRPYSIRSDYLGDGMPKTDLVVCKSQHILVRNIIAEVIYETKQAIVPVTDIADGVFIALNDDETVDLVDIEFDAPHVFYANGLEITSHGFASPPS